MQGWAPSARTGTPSRCNPSAGARAAWIPPARTRLDFAHLGAVSAVNAAHMGAVGVRGNPSTSAGCKARSRQGELRGAHVGAPPPPGAGTIVQISNFALDTIGARRGERNGRPRRAMPAGGQNAHVGAARAIGRLETRPGARLHASAARWGAEKPVLDRKHEKRGERLAAGARGAAAHRRRTSGRWIATRVAGCSRRGGRACT